MDRKPFATAAAADFLQTIDQAARALSFISFSIMQKSRLSPTLLLVVHSELQLQRELDLPRGRSGIGNDAARGAVVGALENNFIRIAEIRLIQNIERRGAEL